LAAITLNY